MNTHVIVTYATGDIPVSVILAGFAVVLGSALMLARRYPLAQFLGYAVALAGWILLGAQEARWHEWSLAVSSVVLAILMFARMWAARETVQ